MDQLFFYRAFMLVSGVTRRPNALGVFGRVLKSYDAIRPANMERFDPSLITQVLNEAGKDYMTACRNHVVLNMTSRVKKAFVVFLDDAYPAMKAKDKWKLARRLINRLSLRATLEDEPGVWESLTHPVALEQRGPASSYIAQQRSSGRVYLSTSHTVPAGSRKSGGSTFHGCATSRSTWRTRKSASSPCFLYLLSTLSTCTSPQPFSTISSRGSGRPTPCFFQIPAPRRIFTPTQGRGGRGSSGWKRSSGRSSKGCSRGTLSRMRTELPSRSAGPASSLGGRKRRRRTL